MKTKITKKLATGITILMLIIGLPLTSNATVSCEIEKQNGSSCFYTELTSVTDNGSDYTIVMTIRSTGGSGSSCKELSHFTVGKKNSPYTYSNVSVNKISGSFKYDEIEYGDWSSKKDKLKGFKIDGTSKIGDGDAGVFTITFTVSDLHDMQTLAKAGQNYDYASFSLSDFQDVLNCGSTPECDITVVKNVDKASVNPGGQLIYTITVTNNGPDLAENVSMEDIFPNTLSVGTPTVSTGSWSAPDWTIGNLASGASETFMVTTTVSNSASGTITNTATVTTTTEETDYTNNTDNASTTVVAIPECDITVVKNVDKGQVEAGGQLVYSITVTNNGPDLAENVNMEDIFPNTLSVGTPSISTGSWSAPDWTIGNLASGASETFTVTTTVSNSATGNITNTAVVTTTTDETDYTNNSDDAVTTISTTPNLDNFLLGTLAFEDLWPGKGDYDFNDLVIDYDFTMTTNPSNYLIEMKCRFIIEAFGAGFENGFGFQLANAIDGSTLTVTGYELTENYITLNGNGTEQGQSKATIIVFDNAYNQMQHPGSGIGVNTDPYAPYVTPDTIDMRITFPANTYTLADLDIANFNPFLIVDQVRGHEVHLPNYAPTDLVDNSLFGTYDDDSNPALGRYYKTENNLPWAIHIYNKFDYPKEKVEISSAHLHFIEWAESSGTQFPDWYLDQPGYRNDSNIY